MIEREIISIQNIDFFDVTIDVTNDIIKNKMLKIDLNWLINNVNINIDSFDDKNVAKNIDIAIIVFDIDFEIVNVTISFNMIFANSFDIIIANSFNVIIANSFDIIIAIVVILTNFVFDVKKKCWYNNFVWYKFRDIV